MRSKKSLAKNAQRANRKKQITGYVLAETNDVVIIATTRRSKNVKTGNMVQIWILYRHLSPIEAAKQGKDSIICFDCPHRGDGLRKRTCYVDISRAPMMIWKAYQRGSYSFLPTSEYQRIFAGRKIRFGAYGEPVLIPLSIVAEIARVAKGHTGYTHQWRQAEYPRLSRIHHGVVRQSSGLHSGSVHAVAHLSRTGRIRRHVGP